jgi:hypothetical protein
MTTARLVDTVASTSHMTESEHAIQGGPGVIWEVGNPPGSRGCEAKRVLLLTAPHERPSWTVTLCTWSTAYLKHSKQAFNLSSHTNWRVACAIVPRPLLPQGRLRSRRRHPGLSASRHESRAEIRVQSKSESEKCQGGSSCLIIVSCFWRKFCYCVPSDDFPPAPLKFGCCGDFGSLIDILRA